jgi:Protein of unknown function (DUF2911)
MTRKNFAYSLTLLFLAGILGLQSCDESYKPARPANGNASANFPSNKTSAYQPGLDKSPLDIIYYPLDYPKLKSSGNAKTPLVARILYSRPQLNNRKVFGTVQPYGQPWRLGANEATELELFREVTIQGKKVPAGRYILYAIPKEKDWDIVFNTSLYTWGLEFDKNEDRFRFTVPVSNCEAPMEVFTMNFEPFDYGARLVIAWELTEVKLEMIF